MATGVGETDNTLVPEGRDGGRHQVHGGGGAQLSLDGVVLGSAAKGATGSLMLVLSRYVFAMVDDFAVGAEVEH